MDRFARVDQSVGRIAALIPSGTETLAKIDASSLKSDLDIKNHPMAKISFLNYFIEINCAIGIEQLPLYIY